ncbi:MAG: DNA polymerase/3'-5' exonuclease PolX [Planctomycetota bacterium]|nr:DNA polymerase/3'-5' exonuclease PolX [Planctomycetota bacterium]
MTNAEIATLFDQLGDLLEFQGANAFRVRAYRNASRTIRDLAEPLSKVANSADRKLTDLDGIGNDLAEKIQTLLDTGRLPMLEELQAQIPASVMALLRIPGLGPKKAAMLHRELKINGLEELRAACEAGEVRKLKGFGQKTEATILAGIGFAASEEVQRLYWAEADLFATQIREYLCPCVSIKQLEIAGSYRRGRETIGDLDVLVDSDNPNEVMDRLATFPMLEQILGRGETKMSIRLTNALQIDLRIVPTRSFGAALQYFTGSKDHNVVLRGMAKQRGLKINEYGVFNVSDQDEESGPTAGEYIAGATEEDVYATLNLPLFPPELREARREFDWAAAGELPKLIELADIQGDLHMHTTATDGRNTLAEMVAGAIAKGLKYIAITDHSKRVSMANGLDADRVRRQWETIDELNATKPGILVLKGIEVDILELGGLDLPDDILEQADWVVASVHYGQQQPIDQITKRIVDALANPAVCVIAHPTGRLINRRKEYAVDLEAVYEAAARHHKFLELNASPKRLDLNDIHCAAAKQLGIPIVISTDAHSVEGLNAMRYGILQARRAGLTAQDVANTRPWPEIQKLLRR